jgi:YbgC/YbaW family acyl-CoA thioester hydrolase
MNVQRTDFRFFHRMRVRWSEVDLQKIVFNAHYLTFFDTAVGEYWRALAVPYEAAMQQLEGDLYVKKSTLEYHASARYDDMMHIAMKCARIGNSSLTFQGAIFRGSTLLVEGELIYVFANPATQKSQPVPAALRTLLQDFEAGHAMVQTQLGTWDTVGAAALALRTQVFVQEQGIAAALVDDGADSAAQHAVVSNHLGQTVACGRLLQHAPGVGRIGQMAVHPVLRESGLGRGVLQTLVRAAQLRGDHEVLVHAQRDATGFYTREGFVARGQEFEVAGIPHITMVRAL